MYIFLHIITININLILIKIFLINKFDKNKEEFFSDF